MASGGDFNGTYVRGQLPENGSVLANLSLIGVPIIGGLSVDGYARRAFTVASGQLQVTGTTASLTLSDSPSSAMSLRLLANVNVAVVPAPGASWSADAAGSYRLTAGALRGLLWADCPAGRFGDAGGAATLTGQTSGCVLHFRADTQQDVLESADLGAAIASGQVAAEISVSGLGEGATATVESYSDVEVAVSLASGRLTVAVSAPTGVGRSFVLYLPSSEVSDPTSVVGRLDGSPVARASTAADALNATNDAGQPEFYLLASGNLTAVVFTVPSFSVHVFEAVLGAPSPPVAAVPPSVAAVGAAVALGLGLSAVAGASLFRKPRKKQPVAHQRADP